MARPDRIEIGYIARPHGIRGDVSVRLYNPGSTILDEVVLVTLEGPGDAPRRSVTLESSRSGGEHCQVRLEGVSDRTAAEALVGAKLFVDREQLPDLDDGEF